MVKPTSFGYTLAQALAYMDAIYHPDPDRPERALGFITSITTTDDIPVRAGARKYNDVQKAFMTHKTRILLREGKVEVAKGAYASALVLVPYHDRIEAFMKKWGDEAQDAMWDIANEAEVSTFYRQTQDLRCLNAKTVADLFPLPRIDDLLDQVRRGTSYFSVGDIKDAFWNIELEEGCRHKFGYRTHNAFLQPTSMTQGGKNSANEWARCVADTFESIAQEEALVYQDDVLNHSKDFAKHWQTQAKIYQCLVDRRLTLKRSKMHLNQDKMVFLGHMLDESGRYPSPKAVEAIMNQEYPKVDQTAVRSFIGQTLYYRNYIHDYADKIGALHKLTRKGVNVPKEWGPEHEAAVDQIKEDLTSFPCLMTVDNRRPFEVRVDACRRGHGLGAILLQPDDEGNMRPVAFWSKSLSKTERDYSPTELECKALHDCIMHWDIYLKCARTFDVYSDHNALKFMVLGQTASNNGRLMRYLLDMQGYDFNLHYKAGKLHLDADGVSRLLHKGEQPEYLTADDLEEDKGPVSEEEMLLAKDWAAKRERRAARAEERRVERERLNPHGGPEMAQSVKVATEEDKEMAQLRRVCAIHYRRVRKQLAQKDTEQTNKEVTEEEREGYVAGGTHSGSTRILRKRQGQGRVIPAQAGVPHRDDWSEAAIPPGCDPLYQGRKFGHNRVAIMESLIPNAGKGLFCTVQREQNDLICSYEGMRLTQAQVEEEGRDLDYVFGTGNKEGDMTFVDAANIQSCFGRFANDPRDDSQVNAKIIAKGNRFYLVATTEIAPGDEIYLSYGLEYWMQRLTKLPAALAKVVETEHAHKQKRVSRLGEDRAARRVTIGADTNLRGVEQVPALANPVHPRPGESLKLRAKRVTRVAEIDMDRNLEKYSYANVIQSEALADKLQYLVGKKFIDDENGVEYQVEDIFYSTTARVVLGHRKALAGAAHKYDDDPFAVYGAMGLLQLTELYEIDDGAGDIVWPATHLAWEAEQAKDSQLLQWKQGLEVERPLEVEKGLVLRLAELEDGAQVLYRKYEADNRVMWQKMVPQHLRDLAMRIHHEGLGHAGASRGLATLKVNYYWEGMRGEITDWCRSCVACKLRNAYYCRPKVPVHSYPEVYQTMGRLHLDLTGELPTTPDGNRYIMVVKDFMSKYVWIFAIPNKEAETIADILVSEIYTVFGAPKCLVTDNGTEFRNRLNNRLSKLYRINKIHITPYVPRSNGSVEQHNRTLKDQLYHFVNAQHSDWDRYVSSVQSMYNTTVNTATGMTPMWCMFGREASGPDVEGLKDIDFKPGGTRKESPLDMWMDKLQRALQVAWEVVTDRTYYNQIRMNGSQKHWEWMRQSATGKVGGPRALEFKEYEVGQHFYRRRCPVRTFTSASDKEKYKISAKLQARFDGPYVVTARVNAVQYWADINGESVRVHAMNMKPENGLTGETALERGDRERRRDERGRGVVGPKHRALTSLEDID